MAEPTKSDCDNLSQLIKFRCTKKDRETIINNAKSAGLSLSEFVRIMALSGSVIIKQSDADFETVYQLKKLGVNLNQHAKLINSTGNISSELRRTLAKIEALIDQLLTKA